MKSGYVYVISTDLYRGRDIYKIGFTDNLERRMKQFNNTRTHDDQFYIVNYWKTVRYMTLETQIHRALGKHHLKNELFQYPLDKINATVKQIFSENSFFNHHDLVIEGAEANRVKWNRKQGYFSIESLGIEIMMNEKNMVGEVRRWISVNDKYNLYQFICPSYFDDLISFLKEQYGTDDVDELATSVTDMSLGEAAPLDDMNEDMNALTIEE
jgi:hypothetical protein